MGTTLKVRCNGPGRHINEIDIETLIESDRVTVYRMVGTGRRPRVRDRYVQRCRQCTEGDVIVTRAMIEPHLPGD